MAPSPEDIAAETERRKEEHLRIPLERDVQSIPNPWDAVRLRHEAVPEMDKSDIDLATSFLGRSLEAPLSITGMTGGARKAKDVNHALASAAATHGLAMGVGSQRAAIENPALADTYAVILKPDAEGEVPLRMANLGLPQLVQWAKEDPALPARHAETALEMIDGHVLAVHLNALQEAVMPEGDTDLSGGLAALRALCKDLKAPVLVKETGAGIDGRTAQALLGCGVAALDVGGLGGTSFSAVEHHRAVDQGDAVKARLGRTFWDWGLPTPDCIRSVRATCASDVPLIATGGLRTGRDAARALALGADLAGFAGTMFRAAAEGPASAVSEASILLEELKTSLYLAGVRRPVLLGEESLS